MIEAFQNINKAFESKVRYSEVGEDTRMTVKSVWVLWQFSW